MTRRVRGDIIEVFKIIKGFKEVDSNTFVKIASSTNLRGFSLKLYKHNLRLDTRKYFFSQRVIDMWNKLDTDVIACRTVSTFKKHLDNYIFHQVLICQSGFLPLDHHVPWWSITINHVFICTSECTAVVDHFDLFTHLKLMLIDSDRLIKNKSPKLAYIYIGIY